MTRVLARPSRASAGGRLRFDRGRCSAELIRVRLGRLSLAEEVLDALRTEGLALHEIAVFARTRRRLEELALHAVRRAGIDHQMLDGDAVPEPNRVVCGTLHGAKGLEFRAVAVIGCDRDQLPLQSVARKLRDVAPKRAEGVRKPGAAGAAGFRPDALVSAPLDGQVPTSGSGAAPGAARERCFAAPRRPLEFTDPVNAARGRRCALWAARVAHSTG